MHASGQDSVTLQSIVGRDSSIQEFFEKTWQKECKIFRNTAAFAQSSDNALSTASDGDSDVSEAPLNQLVRNAWFELVSLLQEARGRYKEHDDEDGEVGRDEASTSLIPLLFRNGQSMSPDMYGSSLFHAYLDGCSVVVNHADWSSAGIARVCLDLQRTFPHVYANTYLTPNLCSQAVPPHADDRDVFVIQLLGKKQWKVYQSVPIPFPSTSEQVGKDGLETPPQVLDGPLAYDTVLSPGDVLYMPRGFVHEAKTLYDEYSFHVTIAMPTQDWTLAGAVAAATKRALSQVVDFRMAMPLSLFHGNDAHSTNVNNVSKNSNVEVLQQQLDDALNRIRQQVNVNSIVADLREKTQQHNERAEKKRMLIIRNNDEARTTTQRWTNGGSSSNGGKYKKHALLIGRDAAANVTLDTIVRASTLEEKSLVVVDQPRGLHVRDEIADELLGVLQHLKSNLRQTCQVSNLASLMLPTGDDCEIANADRLLCSLTILSFARCCVELGGMTIVQ